MCLNERHEVEEAAEKVEESLLTKSVNDVYTDVFDARQEQEESPILKAQRYLNIFRQIHIFNPEKRKEFDNSLLLIDIRTKEAMASIPGGKILLEHLHELQEKNGLDEDTIPFISSDTTPGAEEQISSTPINQAQAATAVAAGGSITLSSTFAKDLAQSLAIALKTNNVITQQQNNDLSGVLSRSLGSYATNLQKMTEEFFSKHLQHFDDMQTRWLSQVHEQINLQNDYQNKLLSQQTEQIQLFNQQQSKQFQQLQQLQSQNMQQFEKIQSQNLQHFEQLQTQTRSVSTQVPSAGQLNTQTNNANSTTINNVNFDPQSLRLHDITSAIIETFKETNKQQMMTLKELGEALSKSIIQSQRELSETILKARPHIHIEQPKEESEKSKPVKEDIVIPEPKVIPEQNVISEPDIDIEEIQPISLDVTDDKPVIFTKDIPNNINIDKKNKNADKSARNNDNKSSKSGSSPSKPQIQEKNVPANKEAVKVNQPKQDIKIDKNKNNKEKSVSNLLEDVEDIDINAAFSSPNNKQTGKPSKEKNSAVATPKPEPKKEAKEASEPLKEAFVAPKPEPKKEAKDNVENNKNNSLHLYDDAMQRIKDALNNEEPVFFNDIETPAVSLENQNSAYGSSADDDLWNSFAPTNQETPDDISSDTEWEYVDENGNPITDDDNAEWEYVDENGNPITDDDNAEWEYVDENGNPVTDDGSAEWEYVDENGNPVTGDDDAEWEYVDENGNPITDDDNAEWEYVDENGNPITKK